MKKIIILALLFITCSCNMTNYVTGNTTQTSGLDFSKGRWLLGDIEVDYEIKEDLTQLVLTDFSKHLNERLINFSEENTVLLPSKIPLNPNKNAILDLKKGTKFDYFINIKCDDERNDLSNFNFIEHAYYKKQMTFARLTLQVYDLNLGEMVYNQTIYGSIDEDSSVTFKPKYKVIMGCYNKIIKSINAKSIKN